ncbi:hypothetical protein [Massilia sp. CF038]|uniref:hypothetical protein n=1 Tax=Massilia sp. CF038 TaxID=1881045 RepID=UPI00091827D1|nr:hypothetical protein [Massilia sp. CF038]SHH19160.1 hypothetical protein SAMN05428948_3238 [Massilia sp. CF038]
MSAFLQMNRSRAHSIFVRLLGGALLLPVLLYLLVWAINWRDAAPTPEATRLEQMAGRRPALPDSDNGYLALIAMQQQFGTDGHRKRKLAPPFQNLLELCTQRDQVCARALDAGEHEVRAWLVQDAAPLRQYEQLIGHSGWRFPPIANADGPWPDFRPLFDGQRLLMLRAWTLARAGDAAGVRALLEKDARFWRIALASSDDLLGKMITAKGTQLHLTWGNLVLRSLPPEAQRSAIPAMWQVPISIDERSVLPVAGGEMRLVRFTLTDMLARTDDPKGAWNEFAAFFVRPLIKPQASLNDYAADVIGIATLLDVDYSKLPAAKTEAKVIVERARSSGRFWNGYNLVGKALADDNREVVLKNGLRLADLEGVRMAALATVELRSSGVPAEQVEKALRTAAAESPYPGKPFWWHASTGSVVFDGLEAGDPGVHAFVY